MTQTVANISAYVSILSRLIMGRRVRGGGDGVTEAAAVGKRAWFVTRSWNLSRSHSSFGFTPPLFSPLHLQPRPSVPLLSPFPK